MNYDARQQGQILGAAAQGVNSMGYGLSNANQAMNVAAPPLTIGDEIDNVINGLEGRLESLRHIKAKFANGGALALSLHELRKALGSY